MTMRATLIREAKFTARDRTVLVWMFVILCLSSLSLWFGLGDVRSQNNTLQHLIHADRDERVTTSKKLKDWGSAAYYNFHLVYEPPSDFAFVAMGQRDSQPWKHRIRMLAVEGQIYERDTGNPVVALIGRFDFAFLATFILPLVLIMLLYDVRSSERVAGRHNLLEATAGRPRSLWLLRVGLRMSAVVISLMVPLIVTGLIEGTSFYTLIWASLFVIAYTVFWTFLCYVVAAWKKPSAMILMSLMGIWLSLTVVIPTGARLVIDRIVPVPSGAEILMLQRETVNDAWDIPKERSMATFFEHYPQWSDYVAAEDIFDWPWYYAFQQLGDQRTQTLSKAYRDGRLQRDRLAGWAAVLAPPALLERALQTLAETDLSATIAYEDKVRQFHSELRLFYYPKFFNHVPFDPSSLDSLPQFSPEK